MSCVVSVGWIVTEIWLNDQWLQYWCSEASLLKNDSRSTPNTWRPIWKAAWWTSTWELALFSHLQPESCKHIQYIAAESKWDLPDWILPAQDADSRFRTECQQTSPGGHVQAVDPIWKTVGHCDENCLTLDLGTWSMGRSAAVLAVFIDVVYISKVNLILEAFLLPW